MTAKVIGFLVILFVVNYATAHYFDYPYVYCYLSRVTAPVIGPWLWIGYVTAGVLVFVFATKGQYGKVALALLAFFFIFSAPVLADNLLSFGKSCS